MLLKFKFYFLFLGIVLGGFSLCKSQDTLISDNDINEKRVEWVEEFPTSKKNKRIQFSERLKNLVFGNEQLLIKPISVVVDKTGSLIVTDQGLNTIIKLTNQNSRKQHRIKKGQQSFSSLVGICMFNEKGILFSDSYLNKVFFLSEKEQQSEVLNKSVELLQPTGIVYSTITKEIWVVETAGHRISILNEQGELIRTLGRRGNNPGEFNYPTFIWIDKFGIIYVVDSLNFRVQIFDKTGEVIGVFGEPGDGSGNFARPKGIAVDSHGNIYVADALFHTIQIFDKSGNYLYNFGSHGRNKGQFWMPTGIFIDENDNIYVADSYNARIQKFRLVEKND